MFSKASRAVAAKCAAEARRALKGAAAAPHRRGYHFASTAYAESFGDYPSVDAKALREDAAAKVRAHEANGEKWFTDPVVTRACGASLRNGVESDTVDAFGNVNGRIIHATEDEVSRIIDQLKNFNTPTDLRKQIRAVEAEILSVDHAGDLIANQAIEFKKQDGVTEIEESIEANQVEQRLNDLLLQDEVNGVVQISRAPVFVGCVSNFSNFLDLCRKTLRHLEVGVPCVVLSRENTTQHMYRWADKLIGLLDKHGVDPGMFTYLSCTRDQTQRLFAAFPDGPMHITCSREVAGVVRSIHKNVLSSTGGPNTMVATKATPGVMDAVRMSAMIENSGQCTALRHAVINTDAQSMRDMFETSKAINSAADALEESEFANVYTGYPFEGEDGYEVFRPSGHGEPCAFRVSSELPPDGINEHWRQVYVDVTAPEAPVGSDKEFVSETASWLVRNQPITLAVNGDYEMAKQLFEETGQVVYTVGGVDEHVALSVAARPQDGEIFGEFPVRRDLFKYTKFPMVVPSPVAGYNSCYRDDYLAKLGNAGQIPDGLDHLRPLIDAANTAEARGFMLAILEYLHDACGPKQGWKSGSADTRTVLYGLQRPPINGQPSVIRLGASSSLDDVLPVILTFRATNARDQFCISCDPSKTSELEALRSADLGMKIDEQTEAEFDAEKASDSEEWYNVIDLPEGIRFDGGYPLVGQFVSLWFPMGHIKSAAPQDQTFIDTFSGSRKWLAVDRA